MLNVKCETCGQTFWVQGYITQDSYFEPGEVVTELECVDVLCDCLKSGEQYEVVDESVEYFDDDVI